MADASKEKKEQPKDILYQPGISFMNPSMVRIAAPVRQNPWFWEAKGIGPLSAVSKLKRWEKASSLRRYNPVWSRKAKSRNVEKLGAYFHDIPTMDELGAAPPPSAPKATTTRSPLGFLDSLITTAEQASEGITNTLFQREQQKTAAAQAGMMPYMSYMRNFGGDNTWIWIAGIGAAALGAYFLIRR